MVHVDAGEMGRRGGWMAVCCALTAFLSVVVVRPAGAAEPAWTFVAQTTNPALTPRTFGAVATELDGARVVAYGGQDPGGAGGLADTWVFDEPGGWTPRCGTAVSGASGACGPGPRVGLGMATGPNGALVFGGFVDGLGAGTPQGDTWAWDGTTWHQVCTTASCGPGARGLFAMAGNGNRVVLFGGLGASGLVNDTWVFDGTAWAQTCGAPLALACGPAPLVGAAMAWDGSQFVLFGGLTNPGGAAPVDDTWVSTAPAGRGRAAPARAARVGRRHVP